MPRRFLVRAAVALGLAALAGVGFLAWIGPEGGLTPVAPASRNAKAIQDLYVFIGAFATLVFLLVAVPLLLFVIRFRSRDRDRAREGPQIRGNTQLELAWIGLPVLILAVIVAFAFVKLGAIRGTASAAGGASNIRVHVEGRQFYWQFEYENGVISIDRLRVPVNRVVRLDVTAPVGDVIHSFWVPSLAGKVDAIPGRVNRLNFRASRTGSFPVRCAEFCGLQHSGMLGRVDVLPRDEFARWLARTRVVQRSRPATLGRELFAGVCAKCHGERGEGFIAPRIAGNPLLGDREALASLVREGRGRMPAVGQGWSDRQLDSLFAFERRLSEVRSGG